jgi:phage terminase Nu1 subunit (DNA packaging protein)
MTEEISINKLAEMTKIDRRTLKKRLTSLTPRVEGAAHLYPMAEAMAAIFGNTGGDELDPRQEQARVNHHKANIAAMEERLRAGELVEVAQVKKEAALAGRLMRDSFQALPSRVSAQLVGKTEREIREALDAEIRQTLMQLSAEARRL